MCSSHAATVGLLVVLVRRLQGQAEEAGCTSSVRLSKLLEILLPLDGCGVGIGKMDGVGTRRKV